MGNPINGHQPLVTLAVCSLQLSKISSALQKPIPEVLLVTRISNSFLPCDGDAVLCAPSAGMGRTSDSAHRECKCSAQTPRKELTLRPSSNISRGSKFVVLVILSKVAGVCAEYDSIVSGEQLLGYLQVWGCWTSCETVLSVKMAGADYHVNEESSQGLDA